MTTPAGRPAHSKRAITTHRVAALGALCGAMVFTATSTASASPATHDITAAPAHQTLKIISWVNPPTVKAVNAIDAAFEKQYPNITVDFHTVADITGPYLTLLETTVDSQSADIVSEDVQVQPLPSHPTKTNETLWQYWTTTGAFAPLNGQPWLSNYTKSSLSTDTYKGNVYGVTEESFQEGVFYNKTDFAKYHLSVPKTYSQFLKVCETLSAHHLTPIFDGLGNVGASYLQFLYYELMGEVWAPHVPGGNLTKALEDGTTKWTSPYFIQAMNELKAIGKYLEPGFTGVSWESMPGSFAKNDAAMLIDGSWDMPSVQAANPSIKVGFFPLPGSNVAANNMPNVEPNLTYAVLKKAPDKSAAMKWLAFLSKPQNYDPFVDTQGGSTTETGGKFSGFTSNVMGSWAGKGFLQGNVFPPLPAIGPYYDEAANWPDLQLDIVQGSKTPQQVAASYQAGWAKVIGK